MDESIVDISEEEQKFAKMNMVFYEFMRVTVLGGKIVISDFSKEGFSIIEKIHESERRQHDSGNFTLNEIAGDGASKDLEIERHNSKCQDLIIMHKRSD